ncbi:hypothetical protein ACMYYO_12975 [Dermacoccaceae bacterium W4C1]
MNAPTRPGLTLAAIRFTDDIPAMRRFLETLGLATVRSWGEGMDVLASGGGEVWLHAAKDSATGAPAGSTFLTGHVQDATALREQLTGAGYDADLVDEAYAVTVEVTDPLGDRIVINDRGDGYGAQAHEQNPDARTTVSLCRFTDPQGEYVGFVEALGLQREGDPNEWYVPYSAGAGTVGLHWREEDLDLPGEELGGAISLGLLTSIPLTELQDRLTKAGYPAGEIITEEFGSRIETTDPDGRHLQIHAA